MTASSLIAPAWRPLAPGDLDEPEWSTPSATMGTGQAYFFVNTSYRAQQRMRIEGPVTRVFYSHTYDGGARLRQLVHWIDAGTVVFVKLAESAAATEWLTADALDAESFVAAAAAADQPHIEALDRIQGATELPQERIARLLGVSRQTLYHWKNGKPIADKTRQRLFAVRDVLERAAVRHPGPSQLVAWLDTPRGVDGLTPAKTIENGDIDRARLLAISSPSSTVKRPPAWVRRPVPGAFRAGEEHRHEALPPEEDDELFARFGDPGDSRDNGAQNPGQ